MTFTLHLILWGTAIVIYLYSGSSTFLSCLCLSLFSKYMWQHRLSQNFEFVIQLRRTYLKLELILLCLLHQVY